MAKPTAKTEAITVTQLIAVSGELKRLGDTLAAAAETAKLQPEETLAIYNWASCESGLIRIQAFVNDAHKAKTLAEMGNPREVGQLKPRSTAKKKADKVIDRGIKELKKKSKPSE